MLKWIRTLAWAAIAALALAAGAVLFGFGPKDWTPANAPLSASIGGPFTLTTHTGAKLSSASLKGKPFAVFFGFTYCPDVCPTSLLDMSNLIKDLGPDAQKMRYLFISVDTERDTPEQLKLYLSSFDPAITGLTGSAAEIADAAKKYRAIYEKVPTKEGYTYNHTATTYLMDRDGKFVSTLAYQEKPETALPKLRRLIAGQ